MACSTTGPIVMLGTKRPSITSTWIQSAPALSTARTSSPSRVKSAERTDGATRIGCMVAPRLALSRGRHIDKPDELPDRIDAGGWRLTGTRTDGAKNRRLLLAGHQKCDLLAALDRRIGQRDADLRPPARHSGDPVLPLSQHRIVRQQRGRVAIGAEAKQSDVEQRPRSIQDRCTIGCLQTTLIVQGGVLWRAIDRHGMDILCRDRCLGEHGLAGHPVIALRVIIGNEALVAPIPGDPRPWETSAEIIGSKERVEGPRGRAAGKRYSKCPRRCERRRRHPFGRMARERRRIRKYFDVPVHLAPRRLS